MSPLRPFTARFQLKPRQIYAKPVEAKPEPVEEDSKNKLAAGQGVDESAVIGGDVKLRTIARAELNRINTFDAGTRALGIKIDTVLRHIKVREVCRGRR